jgi:hypothetical protein
MSTLNGERIEELLWEQGLDYEHKLNDSHIPVIEVYVGRQVVVVGEIEADDGTWVIDSFTVFVEPKYFNEGKGFDETKPIHDERSLVQHILRVGLDSEDAQEDAENNLQS